MKGTATHSPAALKLAEMDAFMDSAKLRIARSSRIQNIIVVSSAIL